MGEYVPTIGLACQDIDLLRARCQVSGIRILGAAEARLLGYIDSEVIIPTELRCPTDEELEKLIATPDTDITMRLCRLPRAIGGCVLNDIATIGAAATKTQEYPIAPGISARYIERAEAHELAPTSSVDNSQPKAPRVGLHIDNYPPDTLKHIIKLGPGPGWHLISPAINRVRINGRTPAERLAYVRQLDPDEAVLYAILLKPPEPDALFTLGMESYDEALLNVPVGFALHDGALVETWPRRRQYMESLYLTSSQVPEGIYPSQLTPLAHAMTFREVALHAAAYRDE